MGDSRERTKWKVRGHLLDHAPTLVFFPRSIQLGPLFSQTQAMQLEKKKKRQLGEFPKQSKLSEKKGETLFGGPQVWGVRVVLCQLRLVFSSWCLPPSKASASIKGVESCRKIELLLDNQALMRRGGQRTSPRNEVLAGEDGALPNLPCAFTHSVGLDL